MAERLTKKQLKHDKFLQSIYEGVAWAQQNPLSVAIGALVFVALVVLGIRVAGSASGRTGGNPEAERALAAARGQFATGQFEMATAALEDVRTQHRGSRASKEATYVLGNALFEAGDYVGARTAFEDFLKKPLYDDLLADGARLGIAACREESGDLSGAAADYLALWEGGLSPGTRIQAAMAGARCQMAQGDRAGARATYQGVIDAFPNSPEAERAEFSLLELATS